MNPCQKGWGKSPVRKVKNLSFNEIHWVLTKAYAKKISFYIHQDSWAIVVHSIVKVVSVFFIINRHLLRVLQSDRGIDMWFATCPPKLSAKMTPIHQNRQIQRSKELLQILLLLAHVSIPWSKEIKKTSVSNLLTIPNPWDTINKKVTTTDHERIKVKWSMDKKDNELTINCLQQPTSVSSPPQLKLEIYSSTPSFLVFCSMPTAELSTKQMQRAK